MLSARWREKHSPAEVQVVNQPSRFTPKEVQAKVRAKAVIEWRGLTLRDGIEPGIHAQFAKRAIEAHGGVVEFDRDKIRVTLPLSE